MSGFEYFAWFLKIRREAHVDAEKKIEAIRQQYEKEVNELDQSSSDGIIIILRRQTSSKSKPFVLKIRYFQLISVES
jgi:hypothetical protein